jgi:small multidrug resistance family-3 protein
MNQLTQIVSTPAGIFVLVLPAYLEVQGDACFQSGLYHASGMRRFGKLLGVYVVLFFLVAQIMAKLQFHQSPTKPIYLGGAVIIVGGLIKTVWKP